MQSKSGKYLADWTNEKGVRKRKAFVSEDDARAYSKLKAQEAKENKARTLAVSPISGRSSQRRVQADTESRASTAQSDNEQTTRQKLDTLEAERMILSGELRNAVLRAATDLLPHAIRQAKGSTKNAGSPGLLRLITRLAMRATQIDQQRKKSPPTPSDSDPLRQKLPSEPAE